MSNRKVDEEYTMEPDELKDFMRRHGLARDEFADLLGVRRSTLDHWVTKRRHVPPTTVKLIWAFNKNPDWMGEF